MTGTRVLLQVACRTVAACISHLLGEVCLELTLPLEIWQARLRKSHPQYRPLESEITTTKFSTSIHTVGHILIDRTLVEVSRRSKYIYMYEVRGRYVAKEVVLSVPRYPLGTKFKPAMAALWVPAYYSRYLGHDWYASDTAVTVDISGAGFSAPFWCLLTLTAE